MCRRLISLNTVFVRFIGPWFQIRMLPSFDTNDAIAFRYATRLDLGPMRTIRLTPSTAPRCSTSSRTSTVSIRSPMRTSGGSIRIMPTRWTISNAISRASRTNGRSAVRRRTNTGLFWNENSESLLRLSVHSTSITDYTTIQTIFSCGHFLYIWERFLPFLLIEGDDRIGIIHGHASQLPPASWYDGGRRGHSTVLDSDRNGP